MMHRTTRQLLRTASAVPADPDLPAAPSTRSGPPDSGLELLTSDEAARELRLAKQPRARWRVEGVGPAFVKLGGRVAYRRADVEAWIAARRVSSTSQPLSRS